MDLRCDDAPPAPKHGLRFTLSRDIDAPLAEAYAWWTDYDADDPKLSEADRLVTRRPIEHNEARARKRDVNVFGPLTAEVDTLIEFVDPPHRITLVGESDIHGTRGDYRFEPLDGGKRCRLTADFHVFARTWWMRPVLALSKRKAQNGLALEWTGYIGNLERELGHQRKNAKA